MEFLQTTDYFLKAIETIRENKAKQAGQPYECGGGLGYWYDPDLALHYIRERWYDAKSGTWLSVDPVSSEPRYSYVHQMRTTHVDPSGMQN